MVKGNDSLEVNSETHLDDSDSSSGDDHIDVDALNEELSIVCEKLLEKFKALKKTSFGLNQENKDLCSKLDLALQEKIEIPNERDSLKSQLELVLKENEILKNRNDCDIVLKKNEILSSKLDFVIKENESLKMKIALISKDLDLFSKKNTTLQNNIDSHVCHASVASSSSLHCMLHFIFKY